MDDKELLIRQTVMLEEIGKKVVNIENVVAQIKDDHILKTESRLAVMDEKVGRLEKIIYGAITIIVGQVIALVFLWIKGK